MWEIVGFIALVLLIPATIFAVRKAGKQPPSRPGVRPSPPKPRTRIRRNRGFAGDYGDEALPPRESALLPPITEGEGFGPVRPKVEETPRE